MVPLCVDKHKVVLVTERQQRLLAPDRAALSETFLVPAPRGQHRPHVGKQGPHCSFPKPCWSNCLDGVGLCSRSVGWGKGFGDGMGWGQGLGTSGRLPEGISEGGHREGHRSQARTWVCPQRGPLGTNGLYWVELFPWTIDSPGTNPTLTGIFTC